MNDDVIDVLARVLPDPVLEFVVDALDAVLYLLRRAVDVLGDVTGCFTYN